MFNRMATATVGMIAVVTLASAVDAGPCVPAKKHFDVWLRIVDGDLVTGAIAEDETPICDNWRVFGAEFGEEPGFPFSADEPGFQLDNGTVTPGTAFTFLVQPMQVWNGTGFEATDETMDIEFGPLSVSTRTSSFVSGFQFAADGLGGFHNHFELTLPGVGGDDPVAGIYLIPMQMSGVEGSFGGTETFWFVMNLAQDEEDHEAAIDYVVENLASAPCPADVDGSRAIDFGDILEILSNWGPCP